MAWTTGADGFGKARLKLYQTMLQAAIADLNACFTADASLKLTSYGALTTACVIRGDYDSMWDIKTGGPFRIYVSAGGHREGLDETQQNFYIDGSSPSGHRRFFNTTITCVFHQNAFNLLASDSQTTAREDGYQTVMDWLDWDVFGKAGTNKILVPSKCHSNLVTAANPNGYDYLMDNKMVQAMKCFLLIGPAQALTVTGIQAIITGYC